MHDARFVRGFQAFGDLSADVDRLVHGQRAARESSRQVLPRHELEGEEAHVEEFEPGEIQIGRVNGNDIVLPKGNISKRHAKIVYANGSATLSDTNSTNGTFLNGERITSNPLSAADKIYLGEFVITVLGLDDESGDSVEIPLDEATATNTHLGEDVLEEAS